MSMRKLAMITGASSGIGGEIATLAAADGYDLILAADEPCVDAAAGLRAEGIEIQCVVADLATAAGVEKLLACASGRAVDVLVANAGHGLGRGFLDQDAEQWRHVIDTNITGTLLLLQPVLKQMVARGEGRVLITGSIAGHLAGSFQAVYNGTKAFIDSFAAAIGNELQDTGVTITCLKPGATDTNFFRARGHARYQGWTGQKRRSRRRRRHRLGSDEGRRTCRGAWAEEQGTGIGRRRAQ